MKKKKLLIKMKYILECITFSSRTKISMILIPMKKKRKRGKLRQKMKIKTVMGIFQQRLMKKSRNSWENRLTDIFVKFVVKLGGLDFISSATLKPTWMATLILATTAKLLCQLEMLVFNISE